MPNFRLGSKILKLLLPRVSLGSYARILFILGMIDRLAQLVDPAFDKLGLELETENLPKRIRIPRRE